MSSGLYDRVLEYAPCTSFSSPPQYWMQESKPNLGQEHYMKTSEKEETITLKKEIVSQT